MALWTVIAHDDGNAEAIAFHLEAADPEAAIRAYASAAGRFPDICILGAIAGHVELHPPGCDSAKSAYACDLVPEEEEVGKCA